MRGLKRMKFKCGGAFFTETRASRAAVIALIVLSFLFVFLFKAVLAQEAGQGSLSSAPLNPKFLEYMANKKAAELTGTPPVTVPPGGHAMGSIPSPIDFSYLRDLAASRAQADGASYPSAFDLRSKNKVSPVRDQGNCASSWAFAALASLESHLMPAKTDFSEQFIMDTNGYKPGPCAGGNQPMAIADMAAHGVFAEHLYPYQYSYPTNPMEASIPSALEGVIIPYVQIIASGLDSNNNPITTQVKQAVYSELNAVAISLGVMIPSAPFLVETTGDWCYFSGGKASGDVGQSVAIIGWDDNFPATKFGIAPPGNGAWLVKNSWGTDWGNAGYFWMSYYEPAIQPDAYVFNSDESPAKYDWIYQYDMNGWTSNYPLGSNTASMANVFNGYPQGKVISAVSFYTVYPNTSYTVKIYDSCGTDPVGGKLLITDSGTFKTAGYNTHYLSNPVTVSYSTTSAVNFSVVVTVTAPPGQISQLAVQEPLTGYSDSCSVMGGQSFTSPTGAEGSWKDMATYHPDGTNVNTGCRVCIKAFANTKAPPQKTQTTTKVGSSEAPSYFGDSVTFYASVEDRDNDDITGAVQFEVDGKNFGAPVPLSGGSATSPATSSLSVATHTVTANYIGDTNYVASAHTMTQTVKQMQTSTRLSSSKTPSNYGDSVTFTAEVSDRANDIPGGAVQFAVDGKNFGQAVSLNNCYASINDSSLTVGNHTVTAYYNGDTNHQASSITLNGGQSVNQIESSTSVSSSADPSTIGQSVTFTAAVTAGHLNTGKTSPTGTVQFVVNGTNFGQPVKLTGGIAVISDSSLSLGNHTVTANYSGDKNFTISSGTLSGGQIVQASTATSVISSVNPSTYGQSVTFTAAVSPSSATGTVTFKDGSTVLGTAILGSGIATYSTSSLTVGSHTVTATYSGDSKCKTSSGTLSGGQTVKQATVTPSITASNKTYDGTTTASVTGSLTGVVSGDTVILMTPIAANFATKNAGTGITVTATGLTLTGSPAASYKLSSTTAAATGAISARPITVTAASNSKVHDGTTSAAATPTITSGSLAPGDTANFIETYDTPNLGTGKTLTPSGAVSDGNSGNNYAVTFVNNTTGAIEASSSMTTLKSSPNPSTYGQSVTFTAAVSPSTATGTVTFKDGSTALGTGTLSNGIATYSTSSLSAGNHTITAAYGGDNNYAASNGALSGGQTVNKTSSTTTVTSSEDPSNNGDSVTFTANVASSGGNPTGTVQFVVDGTNFGSPVTLTHILGRTWAYANSSATSSLSPGNHTVKANYSGDKNFIASSGTLSGGQKVKDATTMGVVSSKNPSYYGDSVTFSAIVTYTVSVGANPTGTVQFVVDGTNFGNPVSVSTASSILGPITSATSLATSSLTPGNHTVSANYSGDNNFVATSGTLSGGQTVNQPIPK